MIPVEAYTAECLESGDRYYFDGIEEMIVDLCEREDLDREDYPVEFHFCKRKYYSVRSVNSVIEGLVEDFLWRRDRDQGKHSNWWNWWHNFETAETIGEYFLECTYDRCEDKPPDISLVGLEDLQWALDFFTTLNTPIWRAFAEYRWFDPVKWAIAPNVLQGALERFEALNQANHYVYVPCGSAYKLEWDDVKDIYAELDYEQVA